MVQLTAYGLMLTAALAVVAPAGAETLVSLDYGWRTDGKISCAPGFLELEPWRRAACIDPVGDLEGFAQRMDTQFASNPSCHGIVFIRFPWGPMALDEAVKILKRPHWFFFIWGYNTGDDTQAWKLGGPDKKLVFEGKGSPREIAQEVCSVITGMGGSILR